MNKFFENRISFDVEYYVFQRNSLILIKLFKNFWKIGQQGYE